MVPQNDWEAVENMEKFGGSFVVKLASLLHSADSQNYTILRINFAKYFDEYHPSKWQKKK